MIYLIAALAFILFLLIVTNIRIVPQSYAYVIERLGAYSSTWQVGLHVKLPLIDRMANSINVNEIVLYFKPQPVI